MKGIPLWFWLVSGGAGLAILLSQVRRGSASTQLLTLRSQAFPDSGHPGALVHVPASATVAGPYDVVVYFHGHNNCAQNVAGNTPGPCRPGGRTRGASNLIGQFDALGANAVLVVPQLRFDEATGDPGRLRQSGAFRALLEEALAATGRSLDAARKVVVCAHSGGYLATAAVLRAGGVGVAECVLFDALYGESATFAAFAQSGGRLANFYTAGGGTAENSRALAARLMDAGLDVRLDDTTGDLTPEDYAARILFKRTALSHGAVPSYYFGRVLAHAGLLR